MITLRAWNGLRVALVDTRAGAVRATASSEHRLAVHVGRPVHAVCAMDGRTHRRLQSRGDIDLVPAGVEGVWEDDRSSRILTLSLSQDLLAQAAQERDPARVQLVPRLQVRDPRLEHLAWALEAELSCVPGDTLYGESLALALAAHLVRSYTSTPTAPEPGHTLSHPQRVRVLAHIEAHLAGPLPLPELAGVAGLGVTHFQKLFQRTTGRTVHRYVVERRVERARLLLEGATPLAEIALMTGFVDQSHLARWMRRILGTTPAALRRTAVSERTPR